MDGKQVGGCMCGDKIYLQRRIQTATEKHLESINQKRGYSNKRDKKTKLSDSKQILEFTQDADGRK